MTNLTTRWLAVSNEAQLLILERENLLGGCVVSRDITEAMVELGENLDRILIGSTPLPEQLKNY